MRFFDCLSIASLALNVSVGYLLDNITFPFFVGDDVYAHLIGYSLVNGLKRHIFKGLGDLRESKFCLDTHW